MRLIVLSFFQTIYLFHAIGQVKDSPGLLRSIDHVPIAVKNLDRIKNLFSHTLHFTIKEGHEHEGIKNCFIKFQDGSYLELITPIDSMQLTGKFYASFLENREGATSLAVSVNSTALLIKQLQSNAIAFEMDSNNIWTTVNPTPGNIFFIEYANKKWKDSKDNTTHANAALSLKSTFILSPAFEEEIKSYTSFGFTEKESGTFSGIPYKKLSAGSSQLYVLNSSAIKNSKLKFTNKTLTGICGFEIKTASLKKFNSFVKKAANVFFEPNRTTLYIQELNLFLSFSE